MYSFQGFLISKNYSNSSSKTYMDKLARICNFYKIEFELSSSFKDYTFELNGRSENVIHLTSDELTALRHFDTNTFTRKDVRAAAERVKDLSLLMAESGLRFSDSHISKSEIQNGYIIKLQKKTGGIVQIPFTNRLQAICEKYGYKLKHNHVGEFNLMFRKILLALNLPTLNENVTIFNFVGDKEIEDTRPKYAHCTAHTLRRTMINQCLLSGLRYDQITRISGHTNFSSFQTYIDRNTKTAEMNTVFDFLNAVDGEAPMMRVVA